MMLAGPSSPPIASMAMRMLQYSFQLPATSFPQSCTFRIRDVIGNVSRSWKLEAERGKLEAGSWQLIYASSTART